MRKHLNKVVWEPMHEDAFDKLKATLTTAPVLSCPDFSKSFLLRTDASERGVGAVLEQGFEDGRHPILFISKKFTLAESKYAVIEKECYGIVWAVKSLRMYLEGKEFVLEMDHAPLQWLHRMKNSNQRLLRWSLTLQEFRFQISYISGKMNVVADMLSRM